MKLKQRCQGSLQWILLCELFINNETAGLTTYFSSVFFGIMSFVSVIVNGMAIGIVGGKVVSMDPFRMSLMFIALIVPHGIF